MTGYARGEGAHGPWRWIWEARSVNGRGLELRFRLPPGFDFVEADLRRAAQKSLGRGNVSVSLNLASENAGAAFVINETALAAALAAMRQIETAIDCERPRPEGVLALRGVVETGETGLDEEARTGLGKALVASFRETVSALRKARDAEGASLLSVLSAQLARIDALVAEAQAAAENAPKLLRDRLQAQIADLLSRDDIDQARLAQEAALLAVKADVREELDRLGAHLEAANALLKDKEPIGRRFDFLVQEFNREANTLCAKAPDMALKKIGLDLKTVIDQVREQVQNIE
jgi:uncharacterized protein (TIGR00255 family)